MGNGSANLDLLRSIAVLLVVAQHLCRRMHVDHIGWVATTSLGLFGVLLFFVHTSLVLMLSMQRSGLTGVPLVRNFYVRRLFSHIPAQYFGSSDCPGAETRLRHSWHRGALQRCVAGKTFDSCPTVVGSEPLARQIDSERFVVIAF